MISKTYKEHLIDTIGNLYEMLMELDSSIINLAMSGEFSEVDEQFGFGDTLFLKVSDFENISDQNVQSLMRVFHELQDVHNSLININGLSSENTEMDDSDFPF